MSLANAWSLKFIPDFPDTSRYCSGMEWELPSGIGPHEGRELELMLAGEKPLAMFNDDLPEGMEPPETAFAPHVAEGTFVKTEIFVPEPAFEDRQLRYYFFALPGEEWRMARLIEIQRGFFEDGVETTPELETEIGRLLGYDDADIQIFVARFFNRES